MMKTCFKKLGKTFRRKKQTKGTNKMMNNKNELTNDKCIHISINKFRVLVKHKLKLNSFFGWRCCTFCCCCSWLLLLIALFLFIFLLLFLLFVLFDKFRNHFILILSLHLILHLQLEDSSIRVHLWMQKQSRRESIGQISNFVRSLRTQVREINVKTRRIVFVVANNLYISGFT